MLYLFHKLNEMWIFFIDNVNFCCRFLSIYPQYNAKFPTLVDSNGQIKSEGKLKAHALVVMYSISSLINHMDDYEILSNLVEKIVLSHRARETGLDNFKVIWGQETLIDC